MEKVLYDDINVSIEDYEDIFDDEIDVTEDEKWRAVYDYLEMDFEELSFMLDEDIEEGIIAIADLGLWNGRVMGYKEIGNNLKDCLNTDCDYVKWYVDGRKNFRGKHIHHDGTNYVLYRMWKEGLSTEQKDNFLDKIWRGKATMKDVSRYTYVRAVRM